MPADPHERDDADQVDDLDGQEAQEKPEQPLPPPGGEGEDRRREEQRRLDAIAPVFDIDTEAAGPDLRADHVDPLSERVQDLPGGSRDPAGEGNDDGIVDRVWGDDQVEDHEKDHEAQEKAERAPTRPGALRGTP